MLFTTPELSDRDLAVLEEIERYRNRLQYELRNPKRWTGHLRRNLMARAIRGSNSIEGYDVSLDDALAAVEEDEPMDADRETWAEITGYRSAMTYIQQLAGSEPFEFNATLLNSLHYMMLSHDLSKSPGQFRRRTVYVYDDEAGEVVYEGPDWELVGGLVDELVAWLRMPPSEPVFVRAAMAHLNLVMIHPWRDGNGRMARALQTLVLARDGILAPEFSSIEEYLGHGRNTLEYYAVLGNVGGGRWNPGNDAATWVSFNLRAHHIQAQTVLRRTEEASRLWDELESLAGGEGLPERAIMALYPAALGLRVRRTTYQLDAEIAPGAATRDLRKMVNAGLLVPHGQTRGRWYMGSERLQIIYRDVKASRQPVVDLYVDLPRGSLNKRPPRSRLDRSAVVSEANRRRW
jgi:Fic family protein